MKGFVTTSKGINHKREVNKAKWGKAANSETNCSKEQEGCRQLGINCRSVNTEQSFFLSFLAIDVNCEKEFSKLNLLWWSIVLCSRIDHRFFRIVQDPLLLLPILHLKEVDRLLLRPKTLIDLFWKKVVVVICQKAQKEAQMKVKAFSSIIKATEWKEHKYGDPSSCIEEVKVD